jgi:hypothetical protein
MERNNYNQLERFLHRLVLGSSILNELLFDLERKRLKNGIDKLDVSSPVYITGLARSGTTALLNKLHGLNDLKSLTYQEMPFVLAPNTWSKINRKGSVTEKKERAHLDGIFIDDSSPEALEEVFWKMNLSNDFIDEKILKVSELSTESLKSYADFRKLVVHSVKQQYVRYLAKNNNLILRLNSVSKNIPEAMFIVSFRSPLEHAASLLNQHIHFCELQTEDAFVLSYMNWIGHHEFGLNQKSFDFGDQVLLDKMSNYEKGDINFWLLNWLNYYQYLLKNLPNNLCLVSYENLCSQPDQVYSRIEEKLNLKFEGNLAIPFQPKVRPVLDFDESILSSCNQVYKELLHVESNI